MKSKPIIFKLNGEKKAFESHPMSRLLDVIREEGKFKGTKEGCGEGECGACSVLVEGKLVNSCLIPLIQVENQEVQTIESVATPEKLNRIQASFLKYGGAQCGICTPGMILASIKLLEKNAKPSEEEIRSGLAGNLCRCTGYMRIFESVAKALQSGESRGLSP